MTKEIMELVARSLPAMQVDALRGELEKAKNYELFARVNQDLRDENGKLEKENQRLRALELKVESIEKLEAAREVVFAKREQAIENTLLKKELEYVKQSKADIFQLANAAFRNTEFKKSMYGSENNVSRNSNTIEEAM